MKLARLHKLTQMESSRGYAFFGSMRAAEKEQTKFKREFRDEKPEPVIDTIEIDTSREGIIKALNQFAGHPDNG